MKNGPIKVLLVEDDTNECNKYKEICDNDKDFDLVAVTNSSSEAIKFLEIYKPDTVILDLELTNGEGSGFEFIDNVSKRRNKPNIVVTTNVYSDSVYDFCHSNKIDFIFYKKQSGYSQEKILETILLLSGYKNNEIIVYEDKVREKTEEDRIIEKINNELDLIGVSAHLHGRKYLCDAIYFVINNKDSNSKISIIQHLVSKYKKSNSSISRAMQNAIIHAWRISPIEDLEKYYTAKVNYETGIPTPNQLIYYYAEKIKREL